MVKRILGALVLATGLLSPYAASAGTLITDLKVGRPAPTDVLAGTFLEAASGSPIVLQSMPAHGGDEGKPVQISRYEAMQIQQGLITGDDLNQGCGGASVATGPAGLLPLAVAGFSLLGMRRRRR